MGVPRQRDQSIEQDPPPKGAAGAHACADGSNGKRHDARGPVALRQRSGGNCWRVPLDGLSIFPEQISQAPARSGCGSAWSDPGLGGPRQRRRPCGLALHDRLPRLFEHEATFRAALRQLLETDGADATLGRGHRRQLLASATRDLDLPEEQARRLIRALSLTFGIEAMVVLKDIWGLSDEEAQETALWAAQAMIAAARRESGGSND